MTPEEWAQVRRIVADVATRGGVEPRQAELIADAVMGRGTVSA